MKLGITTFGCDAGKSGISHYLINLLREFRQMQDGSEIEVLAYPDEKNIFLPEPHSYSVFEVDRRFRSPVLNVAWHQIVLPMLCRRRGYDVLFFPAANRRVSWAVPCPSVGTCHDFSALHVAAKYDPARMFYIGKIIPMMLRRLSHVITVSESSKKDVVEYARVPEDRVTVIPQAADPDRYYLRDKIECHRELMSRYPLRPPYILYVSRIEHPGKNHIRLIRAFERLKASSAFSGQLVLAGSDWPGAEAVHRTVVQSPYAADIIFTGFTRLEDLPLFYGGAEMLVFPSLYEGFGMPLLEAMHCGTPVACSNLSSIPEVVGDAAVLFDPYNEDQILSAMQRLLSDKNIRERCIRLGVERGRQFGWKKTAQKTFEALRSVARDPIS